MRTVAEIRGTTGPAPAAFDAQSSKEADVSAPWKQIRSDWSLSERLREANPYTMEAVRGPLIAAIEAAQTVNDDLFFDPILNAALANLERALEASNQERRPNA